MNTDLHPQVPIASARALAAHLRSNPSDASLSADELGRQFGLAPDFVHDVLEGLKEKREAPKSRSGAAWQQPAREVADVLRALGRSITESPVALTAITTGFVVAFLVGLNLYAQHHSGVIGSHRWIRAFLIAAPPAFVLLQFAAYARHGRTRYAIYGGLVFWMLLVTLFTAILVIGGMPPPTQGYTPIQIVVTGYIGLFLMSMLYTSAGALCAVAGGYFRMRRAERRIELMSRQDLLERYYQLQARLEPYPRPVKDRKTFLDAPLFETFRQHPLLFSAATSVFFHLGLVVLVGLCTRPGEAWGPHSQPLPVFLSSVFSFLMLAVSILMAFSCRKFSTALAVTFIFYTVGFPLQLLPIGMFGPHYFRANYHGMQWIIYCCQVLLIALGSRIGALVEERAAKDRKIDQNDPASVLAEMVRIQWRLSTGASTVCVLVVDAAKSAEMKAGADPLDVEYSFREYQEWLEAISQRYAGRVHATAGDGAVIYFTDCESAFQAGRTMQTDVSRFNTEVNRLAKPFRLRVGLHVGSVTGNLDEVEFTEVIDIAAHISHICTVGGIAVSQGVANLVDYGAFIPLRDPVDGQNVMLAANPTIE